MAVEPGRGGRILTAAILLALFGALFYALMSPKKKDDGSPQQQTLEVSFTPVDGRKPATSAPVNLLAILDPAKHSVKGQWKLIRGRIQTPSVPEGRMIIPYIPPAEYDLKVVATRTSTTMMSLHLGLVAASQQFLLTIDGHGLPLTGIENLDDKPSEESGSRHEGQVLTQGKQSTIVCSVRNSRLTVTVNGSPVLDWPADYGRLSLPGHWKVPNDEVLFLGVWNSTFTIEEITLTPHRPGVDQPK
jgi:hypothetical protein